MIQLKKLGLIFFICIFNFNSYAESPGVLESGKDVDYSFADEHSFDVYFIAQRSRLSKALFFPQNLQCELTISESRAPGRFLGELGPLIYRTAQLLIWFNDPDIGWRLIARSNIFKVASTDGKVDPISETDLEFTEHSCNARLESAKKNRLLVAINSNLTDSSMEHLISTEERSTENIQKVVEQLIQPRADGRYVKMTSRSIGNNVQAMEYICITEEVVNNKVVSTSSMSLGVRPHHRRPPKSACGQ